MSDRYSLAINRSASWLLSGPLGNFTPARLASATMCDGSRVGTATLSDAPKLLQEASPSAVRPSRTSGNKRFNGLADFIVGRFPCCGFERLLFPLAGDAFVLIRTSLVNLCLTKRLPVDAPEVVPRCATGNT